MKRPILALILACLLASCNSDNLYNHYQDLDESAWKMDQEVAFEFKVEGTEPVDVYYNIRNDISYPFYNLYILYELTDERGNILRSSMHESNLLNPVTGTPYGTGESIFDSQLLLLEGYQFPQAGTYRLSIRQRMREQSLEGVLAVGLTLKRAE